MSDVSARLPRPSWADLSARTELTVARRRVLELIETAHRPMTAAEVASALDLHHNTVREHLDALVDAGFVEVSSKPTGRRGRPALRYASTAPNPEEVLDSYLTLLDAYTEASYGLIYNSSPSLFNHNFPILIYSSRNEVSEELTVLM